MDRLTERYKYNGKQEISVDSEKNGIICSNFCTSCGKADCENIRKALFKLAEYEDFEEIFRSKMTDSACDFLKDKEEFAKWLDRNKWIAKKCDEYARAEEQGKLLKLPCKPGDKLYWISDQDEDAEFSYEPIEEIEICNIDYNGYSLQLWFADKGEKEFPVLEVSSIGKELFYTREEAEDALRELEGNGK